MSGDIAKVALGAAATILTGPVGLGLWGTAAGAGAAGAAGAALGSGITGAAGAAATGGLTATQAALAGGFAGLAGSALASGGLGGTSAAGSAATSKQTVMPTPDSKAIQDAQRRSITAQMARRGRASTILTGNQSTSGETLGG